MVLTILVILLVLGFFGGATYNNGAYLGHTGIGVGGILLIILVLWMLGVVHN
jgi:hypothetical protein